MDFVRYNELHADWDTEDRDLVNTLNDDDRLDPPANDDIYLFPRTVIAYNIRLKKWGSYVYYERVV